VILVKAGRSLENSPTKAEEAEAAIPALRKAVQEAETEAELRKATAKAAKEQADKSIAEINAEISKAEDRLTQVQGAVKAAYKELDQGVKAEEAKLLMGKADSEKQLNEYVKMAEARISDMKASMDHWQKMENEARKNYDDFIEKTTGKRPSPPPVTGTVNITLDPLKVKQAIVKRLNEV
jgi:chromosome segregation ATPase